MRAPGVTSGPPYVDHAQGGRSTHCSQDGFLSRQTLDIKAVKHTTDAYSTCEAYVT